MTPLWSPTEQRVRQSHLYRFRERLRADHDVPGDSYAALHRWSVSRLEDFWAAAWADATAQAPPGAVLADHAMSERSGSAAVALPSDPSVCLSSQDR